MSTEPTSEAPDAAPESAPAAATTTAPPEPTRPGRLARFGHGVSRHRVPVIAGAAALVVGLVVGGAGGFAIAGDHDHGDRASASEQHGGHASSDGRRGDGHDGRGSRDAKSRNNSDDHEKGSKQSDSNGSNEG